MDLEALGLKLYLDFVSEEEEASILENIGVSQKKNTASRNDIRRYGPSMPYKTGLVSKTIPDFLQSIADKIYTQNLIDKLPDSICINEYFPGQGIDAHIDNKQSGKIITILGLGSHTFLNFTFQKQRETVYFPARCLLQMKDEIREKWHHSITPLHFDIVNGEKLPRKVRYSVVFRCSDKYVK